MLVAWEADDPELRAEHFLIVASYNLQHPARFTDEALANLRAGLIEHLDRGTAAEELRRRASLRFEGSTRVLKPVSERRPVLLQWDTTIADVYLPDQPESAAERVRGWAAAIRRDLEMQPALTAAPPPALRAGRDGRASRGMGTNQ
jgi:hypothetical protein